MAIATNIVKYGPLVIRVARKIWALITGRTPGPDLGDPSNAANGNVLEDEDIKTLWTRLREWLKGKNPLDAIEKRLMTLTDRACDKFKEVGKDLIADAQQKLDETITRHRLEAEKQVVRLLWRSAALLAAVGVLLLGIAFVLFRVI